MSRVKLITFNTVKSWCGGVGNSDWKDRCSIGYHDKFYDIRNEKLCNARNCNKWKGLKDYEKDKETY